MTPFLMDSAAWPATDPEFRTPEPPPVLSVDGLQAAIDDLAEYAPALPGEVVVSLTRILSRRDGAAAQLARDLRGWVR